MSDIVEWLRECRLQKCQKAADEIEQLREQIKVISGADGTCYAALWDETEKRVNAEKEIERLHTGYGLLCDDYKQLLEDNNRLRDLEAEAIRLDLAQAGIHEAELRRISDACDAEIERLRDALVIANTTAANLHEEIERLRELLRSAGVPEWVTNARLSHE